jgi:hypothetical protein
MGGTDAERVSACVGLVGVLHQMAATAAADTDWSKAASETPLPAVVAALLAPAPTLAEVATLQADAAALLVPLPDPLVRRIVSLSDLDKAPHVPGLPDRLLFLLEHQMAISHSLYDPCLLSLLRAPAWSDGAAALRHRADQVENVGPLLGALTRLARLDEACRVRLRHELLPTGPYADAPLRFPALALSVGGCT